jgi:hypothetical protein
LAILSRRLLILSSGMCSMKSAATSLLTISGHFDDSNLLPSYDEGAGIFSRLPRAALNVLLVQVLGYCWQNFNPTAKLKAWPFKCGNPNLFSTSDLTNDNGVNKSLGGRGQWRPSGFNKISSARNSKRRWLFYCSH